MKFFSDKPETSPKEKVLDVKTLLKLARQYIDDKNIKKAQQCCKKILRTTNNQNYMAFVLLGKSHGKSDDAVSSYEKAIELKPENPLAWQGLAHFYEGKEDESTKNTLLTIYDKILTLNIDEDYATKTLKRHCQLGCLLKNNDTISSFVRYIKTQNNETLIGLAKTQLLILLQSEVMCKNEDLSDIINILKTLNFDHFSEDNTELILLAKLILRNKDFKSAIEDIIALDGFTGRDMLRTWLCKLLSETYIKHNTLHGFDVAKYMNELIWGVEYTKEGGILIAVSFYIQNIFEEAYRKCISVIKENFNVVEEMEALFVVKCSKMTKNRKRTKNLCNYFLKNEGLKNPEFIMSMNTVLLSCYIEEKDFLKSLQCLIKIPVEQMDSVLLTELGDLYFESDLTNDIVWEIIAPTGYFNLFEAFGNIKSKKFSEAIDILTAFDKHPLKYYYLALAYWFLDLNDESLEYFQKAAEIIPNHPKICYCLGIHYYRQKDDIEESKKYLEQSYNLCKTDFNTVKMLSVIYNRLGMEDLEFDLLQSAFNRPQTKHPWICTRLGRICYDRGVMDEALTYLQAATDINPEDVTAQELTGDIYFNKKDYDRALTAYFKVVDLTEDSALNFKYLNRIGSIYTGQMYYHKAMTIYDNILDNDPGNVEALKGLTENRVIFALKLVAHDLFQSAREQMQRAIDRIVAAISIGIKDLVYWLLYGDVLVFMTRLPTEHSFVIVKSSEREIRKNKLDMYRMAIECYSNIMKFRDPGALFKCALTYFEYYCETKNAAFCRTSYNLAILYMKIDPNAWNIWDLLGKICYQLDNRETAYYCFNKALRLCEGKEIDMFYSLELFYLKLDKHQLANYGHVIERFDLSTFAPTLVKEELSQSILHRIENPEIYHIDSLNVEDVDRLEFTEWIRNFDPSSAETNEPSYDTPIESLKRVPNYPDILEWCLCLEEESAWTSCSLGHLQERKGLLIEALRYYDRAYELANDRLKNDVLSHKGRVLMKMREYEEAVNVYYRVSDKKFLDTCALAYGLSKLERYKKSYAAYEKVVREFCENDDQRVDVLMAMSNVAYRLNGLRDGAMLVLRALKIKCGRDQTFNLPFMKAFVFKKVDIQLAAYIMSEYLYNHIDKATWWYYMGLNYLRGMNKYAKLSRACIKRAIRVNTEPTRKGKLYALIGAAEFYGGNRQRALKHIMRAVKVYPTQPDLWAVYILCIYARKTWPHRAFFLRCLINTVRCSVPVSQSLDKWLTKVENEINPKKIDFASIGNCVRP